MPQGGSLGETVDWMLPQRRLNLVVGAIDESLSAPVERGLGRVGGSAELGLRGIAGH
jgi:hypothetical protein